MPPGAIGGSAGTGGAGGAGGDGGSAGGRCGITKPSGRTTRKTASLGTTDDGEKARWSAVTTPARASSSAAVTLRSSLGTTATGAQQPKASIGVPAASAVLRRSPLSLSL